MSIQKLTESFIVQHPYIRSALKKGLINYSSLSRLIAKSNNLDLKQSFDALLIACRRYKQKMKEEGNEKEILELLKKSKIEVKNKIIAVALESSTPSPHIELIEKKARKEREVFRLVESNSAITLITTEDYEKEIKSIFKSSLIKETKGLVEVTIKSSREIESIPGVMAFLYSLLAENGINIAETMSCWTDTIFIIDEKDLGKVMQVMRF
jgi:aspartokinase